MRTHLSLWLTLSAVTIFMTYAIYVMATGPY
jgi:hypothetical protein